MQKRLPLTLDVVILVMAALMVNYQLIAASYHEMAGIGLCGLFLTHFALHSAWALRRLRRFGHERRGLTLRLILDLLLLVLVLGTGVFGVLTSRTLGLWSVRPVGFWAVALHESLGGSLLCLLIVHAAVSFRQFRALLTH